MSEIIGGDQTPTPEQLRKLKSLLPVLKRQAREQKERIGTKRNNEIRRMVDPIPCQICATIHENAGKSKSGFCSKCDENLKAGQTALVTISGRFAFIEKQQSAPLLEIMQKIAVKDCADGKAARIIEALGGSIVHVTDEFMDKIEDKFKTN